MVSTPCERDGCRKQAYWHCDHYIIQIREFRCAAGHLSFASIPDDEHIPVEPLREKGAA